MRRMDLRLRSEVPQEVTVPGADLRFTLASGEEIRVEISTKFTEAQIRDELEAVGLEVQQVWTDPGDDFMVSLARRLD